MAKGKLHSLIQVIISIFIESFHSQIACVMGTDASTSCNPCSDVLIG